MFKRTFRRFCGNTGSNPVRVASIVEARRIGNCITVSHNKPADFRRYSTLLVEVFPDKENREMKREEGTPGGRR